MIIKFQSSLSSHPAQNTQLYICSEEDEREFTIISFPFRPNQRNSMQKPTNLLNNSSVVTHVIPKRVGMNRSPLVRGNTFNTQVDLEKSINQIRKSQNSSGVKEPGNTGWLSNSLRKSSLAEKREKSEYGEGKLSHNNDKSSRGSFKAGFTNNNNKRSITESSGNQSLKRTGMTFYQPLPKRKTQTRIPKNDISQIFNMFCELPPDKSSVFCRKYLDSLNNDEPEIVIDRETIQILNAKKEQCNANREPAPKPYQNVLVRMKEDKEKFSYNPRKIPSRDNRRLSFADRRHTTSIYEQSPSKYTHKRLRTTYMPKNFTEPLETESVSEYNNQDAKADSKIQPVKPLGTKNSVYIQSCSIFGDYAAIALISKEIRIFRLKKYFFNKVAHEQLFSKFFRTQPLGLHIYQNNVVKSTESQNLLFNLVVVFQGEETFRIKFYEFYRDEGLVERFSDTTDFFPSCQGLSDFGFLCFSEKGRLNLYELNSMIDDNTVSLINKTTLHNYKEEKNMTLAFVKPLGRKLSLITADLDGYLAILTFRNNQIRKSKKITSKKIVSLAIIEDGRAGHAFIMVLLSDYKCKLYDPNSLTLCHSVDMTEHVKKISGQELSGIVYRKEEFIIFGESLSRLKIVQSQEKKREIMKNRDIHKQQCQLLRQDYQPKFFAETVASYSDQVQPDLIEKIFVSNNHLVIFYESAKCEVWSSQLKSSDKVTFTFRKLETLIDVSVSSSGTLFLCAFESSEIELRNLYTQELLIGLAVKQPTKVTYFAQQSLVLEPKNSIKNDRYTLAVGNAAGEVLLCNEKGKKLRKQLLKHHDCSITMITMVCGRLITGDYKNSIVVYEKNLFEVKYTLRIPLLTKAVKGGIIKLCHLPQAAPTCKEAILLETQSSAISIANLGDGSIRQTVSLSSVAQDDRFNAWNESAVVMLDQSEKTVIVKKFSENLKKKYCFRVAALGMNQQVLSAYLLKSRQGDIVVLVGACGTLKSFTIPL